jgi:hypothetical protein
MCWKVGETWLWESTETGSGGSERYLMLLCVDQNRIWQMLCTQFLRLGVVPRCAGCAGG